MAKVEQKWEPGTLDKTRKNLGIMTDEEAARMMKVLGGEVLQEKSAPINYKALPNHQIFAKKTGKSANAGSVESTAQAIATNKPERKSRLPDISPKDKQLFDRLMMDNEFKIKTSYGVFNFVLRFTKNNENLRKGFIEYDIAKDIEHFNEFIMAVKSIIQIAPSTYKENILSSEEEKFVFLRTVGSWSLKDVKYFLNSLQSRAENVSVLDTADFIKAVYRLLIKIYYLGENKIPEIFKTVYADLCKYQKINKNKILSISKSGIAEWFYVYSKVIKGFYPLLMRLCSNHFDYFQDFFLNRTPNILGFLGMNKFDLMLPSKKGKKSKSENKTEESNNSSKEKTEEKEQKTEEESKPKKESGYVATGLNVLEQMFPDAGFSNLNNHPDMYPYFQPLYQFRDGFNLLSKENPLQVTIILLRITEDFLQGCRNIEFNGEADDFSENENDKFSNIVSEWAFYRESLFEKKYCDNIKEFVNSEYSNPGDFRKSQYGLKLTTDMLWQTKYYFLPYFKFQQLTLEKPKNDSTYRPLCIRTTILKKYFASIVKNISNAEKNKGKVAGITNPWVKYRFDIQTPISKRLNVILGAKKPEGESKATNANLLKYTLCVISVLDWWLNDKESPAYSYESNQLYRISESDGAPEFSVALRTDQNDIFAASLKDAILKKKNNDENK